MTRRILTLLLLLALTGLSGGLGAQSVADRTPNLTGAWNVDPGIVQFNFIHRFSLSDPPVRKLTNFPTFLVATGVTSWAMVGFNYAPNSDLVPAYPNEWEFFGRALALSQDGGSPLDVSLTGGYNLASESFDGEVLLARRLDRVRVFLAGRAFTEAFQGEEARYAVAGGASLRVRPWLALSGDYAVLLDQEDGERDAWGGGLQLGVPYTPHSFSIQATNVNAVTLEGSSRGSRTRWGFEYTVPITLTRYLPWTRGSADSDDMGDDMDMPMASGDTVRVEISQLSFGEPMIAVAPGTTVVWVNRDQVQHTVTSDEGAFDSGLFSRGDSWSYTFTEVGRYPYHCTPHPFMKGTVVVRNTMNDGVDP